MLHYNLWKWNGYCTESMNFNNHILEGYLKKQVEKMKIFNIGVFPKRYFLIDFTRARLTIYKSRRDQDSAQHILFRDVVKCFNLNW